MNRLQSVMALAVASVLIPSVTHAEDAEFKFQQCRSEMMASLFPAIEEIAGGSSEEEAPFETEEIPLTEEEEIAMLDAQFTEEEEADVQDKNFDDPISNSEDVDVVDVGDAVVEVVIDEPVEPDPIVHSFTLKGGLLKTQLERLLAEHFSDYTPYWDSYEGRHEWYGTYTIEHENRWKILDAITSTYEIRVDVSSNNVIEFIYVKD